MGLGLRILGALGRRIHGAWSFVKGLWNKEFGVSAGPTLVIPLYPPGGKTRSPSPNHEIL